MYKEILKIMYCPICKSVFKVEEIKVIDDEIVEGTLVCNEGHRYAIRNGVIDFCSSEQSIANQWSESYIETDYESFDHKIESMKSDKEKKQQQMILDNFIAELSEMEKGYIVDIASGRGMLLTKLAKSLNDSVNIISTDLSFEVLMYNRLKLKKINPNLHVDYIACDATDMPLKADFANAVVSFSGIANMLGIVENGIKEAARIVKPNGKLFNSFILIDEISKGYEFLKLVCSENNMVGAERTCLKNDITKLHENHFSNVSCDLVCEDIKEEQENKLDFLPYPGEWFAEVIFKCTK